MQMVKIHMPKQDNSAAAFLEMSRRGRIVCLPAEVFVVPEPALDLLSSMSVSYQELGRGGFDYAEKALRDALAAHEQRRKANQTGVV